MVGENRANHPKRRPQQPQLFGTGGFGPKTASMAMVMAGPGVAGRMQSRVSQQQGFGRSDVLGYRTREHPFVTGVAKFGLPPAGGSVGSPRYIGFGGVGRRTTFQRDVLPTYFRGYGRG